MGNVEEKKVGVAVLYSTRYGNPKGTRIGPRYFIHQCEDYQKACDLGNCEMFNTHCK